MADDARQETTAGLDTVQVYEAYLRSPLGRLRSELVWQQLALHLGSSPLRVLDAGSGPGELALRLARAGHTVTLVDAAPAMLQRAAEIAAAETPAVQSRLTTVVADLHQLPLALTTQTYDLVLCHNVLEYSPDPPSLLAHLTTLLTDGGALSLLVANQANPPLQTAIKRQDLAQALQLLGTTVQPTTLMGVPKRTFAVDDVVQLCADAGLSTLTVRPIRVIADLLPDALLTDPAQWDALLALEVALSQRQEYRGIGRLTWAWGTRIRPAVWPE
ncbi:MAG: methyltransferase domain-containing protein [Chloroflexota bacterium]|nr:methyltransferase domain-containing protein [Chloroflexota bacterium]